MAAVLVGANLESTFLHDGVHMVAAFDGNGALAWEARWGPGIDNLVEWRDVAGRSGLHLPLADARNSVVATWSTSDGKLTEQAEYTAEGRVTVRDAAGTLRCEEQGTGGICPAVVGMPFGFQSAWRSSRSGLVFMRNRWYSPELGEFLSHDPIGFRDSFNLYAYVGFDPVNGRDPFGRCMDPVSASVCVAGGVSAVSAASATTATAAATGAIITGNSAVALSSFTAYSGAAATSATATAGTSAAGATLGAVPVIGAALAMSVAYSYVAQPVADYVGASMAETLGHGTTGPIDTPIGDSAPRWGGIGEPSGGVPFPIGDPLISHPGLYTPGPPKPPVSEPTTPGRADLGKRGEALEDIEDLVPKVEEHLDKLRQNPTSQDILGWHDELNAWIGKIERIVNRGLGKKTDAEMRRRIEDWRRRQAAVPDPRSVNLRGRAQPGGGVRPFPPLRPKGGVGGIGGGGPGVGGLPNAGGNACRKSLACPGR